MKLSVREINETDIKLIIDYFIYSSAGFLNEMGADKEKLPSREKWITILKKEFEKTNNEKEFYYIIWLNDGKPIGHSNINNIKYGKQATMHLHIWKSKKRQRGIGLDLLKQTIPFYFKNFKLNELICEPYSLNPAANKILKKVGFEFVKEYETTPGWINFYQSVNRYRLTKGKFKETFG